MGKHEPQQYVSRPVTVKAVQWEPADQAVHGVQARPKKHPMNPDEFFVVTRFGKEILIQPTDWVLTFADGAHEVVEAGAFPSLYAPTEEKVEDARTDEEKAADKDQKKAKATAKREAKKASLAAKK